MRQYFHKREKEVDASRLIARLWPDDRCEACGELVDPEGAGIPMCCGHANLRVVQARHFAAMTEDHDLQTALVPTPHTLYHVRQGRGNHARR